VLAQANAARTRVFAATEAEIKSTYIDGDIVVKDEIVGYLKEKVPTLPANLLNLDSFDDETSSLSSEYLQVPNLSVWAARFTEPDAVVAGRSWSVEMCLGHNEDRRFFGSRLLCFSRDFNFDFVPAVPRVYRNLVSKQVLFGDGMRLSATAIDLQTDVDIDWFAALMRNPRRTRNIIALSCDELGHCQINPAVFSDRLCGVAHVVRIFPEACFLLSDIVGRYLSVFDSGIRVYRPAAAMDDDDPLRHTLYTKLFLTHSDLSELQNTILKDAFAASASTNLQSRSIPTFVQIRSANARVKLAALQAGGSKEIIALNAQLKAAENARLAAETQAREAFDLAASEEELRKRAEDERNQEKARSMVLAARIRALEAMVEAEMAANAPAIPANYGDIPTWVEEQFAGRMKLLPRALRGLAAATFNNVTLVSELLELLATEYVNGRRGDQAAWQRFEDGTKARGVEYTRSISSARAGEQGDEYLVPYWGGKHLLEWHLKRGTSRDPARDMRIYFFWDDEDEEVIIGYLPGHLNTRITLRQMRIDFMEEE
jgi:hypothetical protein